MAKKKKATKKSKTAEPPAKQKKTSAVKTKAAAKKTKAAEEAVPQKKASKPKTKAVAEKKSSAQVKKAVTSKKTTGTMAKKEIPAEPNDKNNDAAPKAEPAKVVEADGLKVQVVGKETQKEIEKRVETKNQLNELVSNKFIPMFSKVITTTGKSQPTVKTSSTETTGKEAAVSSGSLPQVKEFVKTTDKPVVVNEAAAPPNTGEVVSVEVVKEPEKESSGSFFGLKFDFGKMEKDPFGELIDFLNEHKREPVKEETINEDEGPMVIVADFTLPYRCCEDYVCEDMCYTEDELAMLEIPPFAKDDFAVTRKDTAVDIYPDLNDSHVFENYIVVKEIDENQSFATSIGGKVTTDKTGEHPRFIYTPPSGQTGISDSFIYTLYNTKNKLSDTATVWIEVAEALPSFSMNTQVCRNAAAQTINVDSNGNDLDDIEINGPGIEKIVNTSTGDVAWTFNPKFPGVAIGVNTFTLMLNDKEVQRIDVTVTEILADFSDQGELISVDPATGVGTIAIHDLSANVNEYNWEWQLKSGGPIQTGSHIPDGTKTVFLPLPGAPVNESFLVSVTLSAKSPEGCGDIKTMDVGISPSRIPIDIKADFDVNATFVDLGPKSEVQQYNIAVHDKSTNANSYWWEYGRSSKELIFANNSQPDANGMVLLELWSLAPNPAGFTIPVKLTVTSADGATTDTATKSISIAPYALNQDSGIAIIKSHLNNAISMIQGPSIFKKPELREWATINYVSYPNLLEELDTEAGIDKIHKGTHDLVIMDITLFISNMINRGDFANSGNSPDFFPLFASTSIATFGLLMMRNADLDSKEVEAAAKSANTFAEILANANYRPDGIVQKDMAVLEGVIGTSRPKLKDAYTKFLQFNKIR